MRKEEINMDSFREIYPAAETAIKNAENTDVIALTITMNSPLKLVGAKKVTPQVFQDLIRKTF